MYINYKPVAIFWRILTAVLGSIAFVNNSQLISGNMVFPVQRFEYDIGVLTTLYYIVLSFWQLADTKNEKTSLWLNFKYTLMMDLCFVFFVGLVVIHKGHLPDDNESISNYVFSNFNVYLLPFLVLIDWLLFDKKGGLKNVLIVISCIPIWLYSVVTYIMIAIGSIPGFYTYPYFFMSLKDGNTAVNLSLLFTMQILFIVLCYLFILIDKIPSFFSGIASKFKKAESEGGG